MAYSTFSVQGVVRDVQDKTVGQNGTTIRTVVVGYGFWQGRNGQQHENLAVIEYNASRVQMPPVQAGDTDCCQGEVAGREWQGKYYASAEGRTISVLKAAPQPQQPAYAPQPYAPQPVAHPDQPMQPQTAPDVYSSDTPF